MKLFVFSVSLLSTLAMVHAAPAPESHQSSGAHHKDLRSVRKEIDALTRDIAQKEAVRQKAQTAIRHSEQAIKQTNEVLRNLEHQHTLSTRQLLELKNKVKQIQHKVTHTQQHVNSMLVRQYKHGNHDAMRLMLNATDPNQTSRDLVYYQYIVRAQKELVDELHTQQSELEMLTTQLEEEVSRLTRLMQQKTEQKTQLIEGKNHKENTIQMIGQLIHERQAQLDRLKANEKRLSDLIVQINQEAQRVKAQQAAVRKARQDALRKEDEKRRQDQESNSKPNQARSSVPRSSTANSKSANVDEDNTIELSFTPKKGQLKLPVTGEVLGKFGSTRAEGTTWKGIYIRAPQGQAVHAIAIGRVVYSDFLRGFGNAVIIDHGNNYLSVYTGLTDIARTVGNRVSAGETIGTSGALENGEPGVYFELRHLGRPIDPLRWVHTAHE